MRSAVAARQVSIDRSKKIIDNQERGELTSERRSLTLPLTEGHHDVRVIYQSSTRLLGDLGLLGKMFQYNLYIDYDVDVDPGGERRILLPPAEEKPSYDNGFDLGHQDEPEGPTWRRKR